MCSRYVHTIQHWVQTVLAFSSKLLKDFNRNLHIRTIIFRITIMYRICGFIFWHFKRLNFFNLYCRCQTSLWWGPRRRQTRLKRSWKKYKKNFPKVFFLRSGYRANTHSHTIWEKYWRYRVWSKKFVTLSKFNIFCIQKYNFMQNLIFHEAATFTDRIFWVKNHFDSI